VEIEEPSLLQFPDGAEAEAELPPGHGRVFSRGSAVDRYVVLDLIGSGGMGEVYGAYDPELDRRVALKVLRPRRLSRRDAHLARARLVREAQSMARLAHPNVISVYDVGTVEGDVYFAMEYVDGNHLADWVQSERRSYRQILKVFLAAARGLRAAHAVGVVHRDFKPHNVLVGSAGQVRVIDFGLAHQSRGLPHDTQGLVPDADALRQGEPALAADAATLLDAPGAATPPIGAPLRRMAANVHTLTGTLVGTPAYMAPEQFHGDTADARSDQFSYCVALYEALYGRLPFEGDTVEELMANVTAGAIHPPPADSEVPAWLRAAVLKGLHTDPAQRHVSMQGLLEALTPERPPRWGWRLPASVAAALVVAVLGVAGLVHVLRPGPTPRGVCASDEAPAGLDRPHRRQALRSVLGAVAARGGARLPAATLERLDRWTGRWRAARTQACAQDTPHPEADRAADCLELGAASIEGLVATLMSADAELALRAPALAEQLPDPDACRPERAGRTKGSRLPSGPAGRQQALAGWSELAASTTLARAGRQREARARLKALEETSRGLGWAPLHARSLVQLAGVEAREDAGDAATEHLFEAQRVADAADAHTEEALAWLALSRHFVRTLGRPTEALRWAKHAALAARRATGRERLGARLHERRAAVHRAQGEPEAALAELRRARALTDSQRTLVRARLESRLAEVLMDLGRTAEALAQAEQAARPIEEEIGPRGLALALPRSLQGRALAGLGRRAEARVQLRQALGQDPGGPALDALDTLDAVETLRTLARLDAQEGRPDRATSGLLRAIERASAAGRAGKRSLLAARTDLGALLAHHGRPADGARELETVLRACAASATPAPVESRVCARAAALRCGLEVERAPADQAERSCLQALRAARREGAVAPRADALARRHLARLRAVQGKSAEATTLLEQARVALETLPQVSGTPGGEAAGLLAQIRFDLARTLWPGQRQRSLHLAELARASLARAEAPTGAQRGSVEQWLAGRREEIP